jgi:CubicO group peptidase (beta-lactamase class C family)
MMFGYLSTLGYGVLVLSDGADGISAALVVNVLLLLLVYRRNNSRYHYYNQPASMAEGSEGFSQCADASSCICL